MRFFLLAPYDFEESYKIIKNGVIFSVKFPFKCQEIQYELKEFVILTVFGQIWHLSTPVVTSGLVLEVTFLFQNIPQGS